MSTQGHGDVVERLALCITSQDTMDYVVMRDAIAEITRLRTLLSSSRGEQGWRTMDSAPKDGTHIIGNTQWGAREIWWHKDAYEGEYWTDEGDSEPAPTGWIPKPGSVPTSLAGQGTDDWDRIIATLREFSSLRAADGDHWEADAAERAAQEIERIPPVSRPALQSSPQPTAAAGQGTDTCTCDEFQSCPRCHTANLDPDWLEKELAEVAPQPTAGGDAPTSDTIRLSCDCRLRQGEGFLHFCPAHEAALSAERARVIALETALRGAIANLERVSVYDEADDDDQEAIEARSAWQRDLDRFRAALLKASPGGTKDAG